MTKLLLLERCLRICCFTLLGVLLVLVLQACGPGSGGTGTGPVQSFSTAGAVSGGAAPPSPLPADGACGRPDLQLQEDRVELVTSCGNFIFVGGWAADAEGKLVLHGVLESPGAGGGMRTVLRLEFNGAPGSPSATVVVTLTDEAGGVLVGPSVLSRL